MPHFFNHLKSKEHTNSLLQKKFCIFLYLYLHVQVYFKSSFYKFFEAIDSIIFITYLEQIFTLVCKVSQSDFGHLLPFFCLLYFCRFGVLQGETPSKFGQKIVQRTPKGHHLKTHCLKVVKSSFSFSFVLI